MARNLKVVLIVLAALVIAGGAYAFAAQNVVPDSAAGYGTSAVSGYTVSNIAYNLNATDASKIDTITFDLAGTVVPSLVKVQTDDSTWFDCSSGISGTESPWTVTCTYTPSGLSVASVTTLNVVASGNALP